MQKELDTRKVQATSDLKKVLFQGFNACWVSVVLCNHAGHNFFQLRCVARNAGKF